MQTGLEAGPRMADGLILFISLNNYCSIAIEQQTESLLSITMQLLIVTMRRRTV